MEIDKKQEIRVTNSEWYLMNCLWEESPRSLMQLVPLEQEYLCNNGAENDRKRLDWI